MNAEAGAAIAEAVITAIEEAIKLYRAHQSGQLKPEDVLANIAAIASNEAVADAAGRAALAAKAP